MIKNFGILILGIFIGVAGSFFMGVSQVAESRPNRTTPEPETREDLEVTPEVDYDKLYDELRAEQKPKAEEERHWFDEKLKNLQAEAQQKDAQRKAQGEEAAKLFEQFSETSEELR